MREFALSLKDWVGHYGNEPAASVFFNIRIVRKSPTEISTPINDFMGLLSHAKLQSKVLYYLFILNSAVT